YTSFAIDASFLFNTNGKTTEEQLQRNVDITVELVKFIEDRFGDKSFGLECEVGEIGKTDDSGMVITTVDEARTYISMLHKNDVYPHALAIANGSAHGFRYDEHGNPIEQVTIDIPRTIDIAKAIAPVGVAQHGITGTPLHLIVSQFPHGDIIKGNVGTLWMNVAWDILKVYQPDLFEEIYEWTLNKYKKADDITPDRQIFQVNSKNAIKPFFDKIYSVDDDTRLALKARAYYEALVFLRAFKCRNTADLVKKKL
ncbi:MAG: class II fructose-bisphosphate aldolase, partial [Promethearchaeota archaeon]